MRIAMIGTRGVPARYGGFETCVEEVGRRLAAKGHEVTVFCRSQRGQPRLQEHLGMRLVWLPALRRRSLETLSHTGLSVLHPALHDVEAAFVFNAANAPMIPVLRARGIPVATHVDGLERLRAKWGSLGKRYYHAAEALAVRWSDALIADAKGIADYYAAEFGVQARQIAYGAPILKEAGSRRLRELHLEPGSYHLVVARFEPENHLQEIVAGYARSAATRPLIVVGSAPYAHEYTQQVHAAADERVRFLGGVWDSELLDQLYANAYTYLHGHSVGGTNPSLLRAAGAGAYVVAWDVVFNREVLGDQGAYVGTTADVAHAVDFAERHTERVRQVGTALQEEIARYDWDEVASRYETLSEDLVIGRMPAKRPSGRRRRPTGEAEADTVAGRERVAARG